ncbi:MAG: four helix bundle protein [Candidatus Cloacimonadota bacterium]|nr:four helix bundle protein [Candidatus Cloacimonadota bacterium]
MNWLIGELVKWEKVTVNEIKELKVYIKALKFSNMIWDICNKWDKFAKFSIGIQLVKAADSISANIAEGYGRYHFKENLHFCYIARGSMEESFDWLRKSNTRKLLNNQQKAEIDDFVKTFPKEFNGYIKYIKQSMLKNPNSTSSTKKS